MTMERLLIKNIGTLATPEGKAALKGKDQGRIRVSKNAWVLVCDGIIEDVGCGKAPVCAEVLDAEGALVTPGLTDAHTHLVFGGWRQNELALKLRGASYLDILSAGGGILSTVRKTRAASEDGLYEKAKKDLDEMLSYGVTSAELKSGYGLDYDTELKQLKIARRLNETHPMDIRSTFLGAHALPEEYNGRREEYIRFLCEKMIPEVAKEKLADYCDVFCEKGVFTADESKRILEAGKRFGLMPKIHADEIEAIGGSELAGKIGAVSAEHLIVVRRSGIRSMAEGNVIACLLPATSFYLNAEFAPARAFIDEGVAVALGSDYNPGSCPSLNLQFVMNLACLKYRLTPEEMLTAVTLNASAAIGLSGITGSVEKGKQADLVFWNAEDLDYLAYRMGSNLVRAVVKKGKVVYER